MKILAIMFVLMSIIPAVSGSVQTYSTDFGKLQIDILYPLSPDPSVHGGDHLMLGQHMVPDPAFPNVDWLNVIWITKLDPDTAAWSMDADNISYETLTTNDGHKMLFNSGLNDDGRTYFYNAFIDYSNDKKFFILIKGDSERYFGKPIDTFTKTEFENVCRSFTFV